MGTYEDRRKRYNNKAKSERAKLRLKLKAQLKMDEYYIVSFKNPAKPKILAAKGYKSKEKAERALKVHFKSDFFFYDIFTGQDLKNYGMKVENLPKCYDKAQSTQKWEYPPDIKTRAEKRHYRWRMRRQRNAKRTDTINNNKNLPHINGLSFVYDDGAKLDRFILRYYSRIDLITRFAYPRMGKKAYGRKKNKEYLRKTYGKKYEHMGIFCLIVKIFNKHYNMIDSFENAKEYVNKRGMKSIQKLIIKNLESIEATSYNPLFIDKLDEYEARGFIHANDAKFTKDKYYLKVNGALLYYPTSYSTDKLARKALDEVANRKMVSVIKWDRKSKKAGKKIF